MSHRLSDDYPLDTWDPPRWQLNLVAATVGVGLLFATALGVYRMVDDHPGPTIGANPAPLVHCEEDEVIGFVQTGEPPYQLGCVHVDTLRQGVPVDYQDPARPVCFVEPNEDLPEGVEIIWYPRLDMKSDATRGLEIDCPEGIR